MLDLYSRLAERALRDEPPSQDEALRLLDGERRRAAAPAARRLRPAPSATSGAR